MPHPRLLSLCALLLAASPLRAQQYDVLIIGGTVYDGTGSPGRSADVGIRGDRIVFVGKAPARVTARLDYD